MKLSRIGAGTTLALGIFTAWLGACGSSAEPCGIGGVKNGTCQSGSTCPAGSAVIDIVDPFDMCPTSYNAGGSQAVCCTAAGDAVVLAGDSGLGTSPDSTVTTHLDATVSMDGTSPPDAGPDVVMTAPDTGPPAETGTPDTSVPVDTGAPDTGKSDGGASDASHVDGASTDGGHTDGGHLDAAGDSGCGAAEACTAATTCPATGTACVVATCVAGCCGTVDALPGTACTDNGGAACDALGACKPAAIGAACTVGTQCVSGNCVGDVCCDTACSGPCNTCSTGTCGAAAAGATCSTGVCNGLGGTSASCVQCLMDSQCSGTTPACNTAASTCVQCTATNATACSGATPVCDVAVDGEANTCVECDVTADCPTPLTQACTLTTHTCLLATGQTCTSITQCASNICALGVCG